MLKHVDLSNYYSAFLKLLLNSSLTLHFPRSTVTCARSSMSSYNYSCKEGVEIEML